MKKHKIHRVIIEDQKSSTFTGFVTYEIIYDFFLNNFYSDMENFHCEISQLITKNILTVKKRDTIFECMVKFWTFRVSLLPILDDEDMTDHNSDFFGYLFLKDVVYFFSNAEKFSFTDTVEKFIKDLYEDIDVEKPYGIERLIVLDLEESDVKKTLEMMSVSPERKIIFKGKQSNKPIGILTISDIFKIININDCI